MFLYGSSDYSAGCSASYLEFQQQRNSAGINMKPNAGLYSESLRTVAAAAVVTLSVSAAPSAAPDPATPGEDSHASKHYVLPATKENVQWGWYDISEKPKLTIKSGDTVSIETLSHSLGQIKPGVEMDEIVRLRKSNPGGGPHSITGPIFVDGAEPGDTLEIHILKIVPKADGFNFNIPGKEFPTVGQLASEFPEGFVRYYKLDLTKMQTPFKPGIVIDLKPFPGTFAVGVDPNEPDAKAGPPIHDAKGRTSTLRPWKNGSNMDVNELQAGATMYFPVFQRGGLIWTGDSHCRQGNGEVNLTALECS
jgi:acetamidase/formamidase